MSYAKLLFYIISIIILKTLNQLIIIFVFLLSGCIPTSNKMKRLLQSERYYLEVIKNISKYNVLQTFLIKNLDTIINFRNSKNIVTYIGAGNKPDSTAQENLDCQFFLESNTKYDILNFPSFISDSLYIMWKNINQNNGTEINSFTLCRDSTISMNINLSADWNSDISASHNLIWNHFPKRNNGFNKDTIIYKNCMYQISVSENKE